MEKKCSSYVRFVVLIILRSRNQTLFSDINFVDLYYSPSARRSVCFLPYKYSCMPEREIIRHAAATAPRRCIAAQRSAAQIIPLFRQCQISGRPCSFHSGNYPLSGNHLRPGQPAIPNWLGSNYTNLNAKCRFYIMGLNRKLIFNIFCIQIWWWLIMFNYKNLILLYTTRYSHKQFIIIFTWTAHIHYKSKLIKKMKPACFKKWSAG